MEWTKKYKKAVTFSYDDGVTSDLKLLDIFNRYGMKCTFNLNFGLGPVNGGWINKGKPVNCLNLQEHIAAYAGHEIAAHALTHQDLTKISPEEARKEMVEDRDGLNKLFGQCPAGMAYPYGTFNDEVVALLKELGFQYARTVNESCNFDVQTDLLRFKPTCHHDNGRLFELAEQFLAMEPEEPQIFYIWGHSYEFDGNENWDRIEELCRMLAGRDDIFYGTNAEVLL